MFVLLTSLCTAFIKDDLNSHRFQVVLDKTYWNYSVTTSKYRNQFLNESTKETQAKINSGDPVAIAEVVRDLYRSAGQPEQSYSERQMYEAALERLVHEFALVEKIDVAAATEKIETAMAS